MPSEKKTETLKLNQWQENEYPKMIDFNDDNKKIDNAYIKILQLIADKVNKKDIPKNISELKNDKGYITKEELPEKTDLTPVYEEIDKKANESTLASYLRKNGEDEKFMLGRGKPFETIIKNDEWTIRRNKDTGGWSRGLLNIELPTGESAIRIGGYGFNKEFRYLYFGKNANDWNLSVNPDSQEVDIRDTLKVNGKEVPTKDEVVSSINNKKGNVRLTANDIQMDESTSSSSINYTIKFIADEITDRVPYEVFYNHSDKKIHEDEVHGMKFNDKGKLEVFNGNEWIELKGGGLPVSITRNINVNGGNREVALLWEDPEDVKIDGKTVAKWKSTKIVRKAGSKPKNDEDGVLIAQSSIRNQYKYEPFLDNYALQNDVNYYYGIFPESEDEIVTVSDKCIVEAKPKEEITYGVVIDNNNANPETRVKYIDDAVGFRPVRGNNGNTDWGSWKDTFIYEKFKPCIVKDGEVQYYLNREDFTKKEDGSNAVLTGEDGDVMIEIDKMWYKLENDGDKIYVRVSDSPQDGFKCLAHTNGDKEVDKIYVGAYLGYEQSGKLRSISGVNPTGNKTIGSFRNLAEANGDRYHQVPFTALTLLQSIMVILLKSTDTQTALGRGYVDASSFARTGATNSKGLMYGTTSDTTQMCFMGIEDFWGNKEWGIDGLKYDGGSIKLGTTNFNNNASGYKTVGSYSKVDRNYIKSVKGSTEEGFIPTNTSGSSSTYYCDRGGVRDGQFPVFGGYRVSGSTAAGGFYLDSYSASTFNSVLGSRLFMYGE